jgi:hypothetical protein
MSKLERVETVLATFDGYGISALLLNDKMGWAVLVLSVFVLFAYLAFTYGEAAIGNVASNSQGPPA